MMLNEAKARLNQDPNGNSTLKHCYQKDSVGVSCSMIQCQYSTIKKDLLIKSLLIPFFLLVQLRFHSPQGCPRYSNTPSSTIFRFLPKIP